MNPKILIVDDEATVCEDISHYLGSKGYDTIIATSGQQALSRLLLEGPDLTLLDIRMPDMDGIECLSKIRRLNKEALVIMVTCVTDIDIATKAIELGAIDYITKPLGLEALETAITTYLFLKTAK